MTRAVRRLAVRLALLAGATALVAAGPVGGPTPTAGRAAAAAAGLGVGALLFTALTRRARLPAPRPVRPLLLALPAVLAGALVEETAWRYLLLGALVAPVGLAGAAAVSAFGFACAHARAGFRAVRANTATGGAFAAVYALTGRLAAAVAAHAAYNALVVGARLAWGVERASPEHP